MQQFGKSSVVQKTYPRYTNMRETNTREKERLLGNHRPEPSETNKYNY